MSKCLYIEGASGIAGDMTVAALLELGGSQEKLLTALNSLPMHDEFEIQIGKSQSYGIAGCSFKVFCPGGDHEKAHHHHHHDYEHDHDHEHHHHHEHRNLHEVLHIIGHADLTVSARAWAEKIFYIVAEAEAAAHGCAVEEVHFHEVGAVDSIVDIVGTAVLLDDLDITDCVVESLAEGQGYVKCQHGNLPVPVPAVLNIAQKYGIVLKRTAVNGEMVTPTGIAIAAALRTCDKLPEQYKINAVGIGVGKRDFGHANILRLMLVEDAAASADDSVWVLESNIDDCSGEILGGALEKIMTAGALDVHFIPCFMKKNRPAYLLRVLLEERLIAEVEKMLFAETTTIGVRRYKVERSCMARQAVELNTQYGIVQAKKCVWGDLVRIYPEYESVKAVARAADVPVKSVYDAALNGCLR